MSTLKTGALRGTSGTADSIQLHASNQSVTFPGAVTFGGTTSGITTGYTLWQDAVSVGSGTTKLFSNVPDHSHIKIIHYGMSMDGNAAPKIRIGNGTDNNIKSADYFCSMVDIASTMSFNTRTDSWQLYGANESSKAYTGQVDIWRVGSSNAYSMTWAAASSQSTGSNGKIQIANGFMEDMNGRIDRIEIGNGGSSDNFDSGSISIFYI